MMNGPIGTGPGPYGPPPGMGPPNMNNVNFDLQKASQLYRYRDIKMGNVVIDSRSAAAPTATGTTASKHSRLRSQRRGMGRNENSGWQVVLL